MTEELQRDILLFQKNTHGKNCRIHEWTQYYADRRVVIYHCHFARRRLWGLLPMEIKESQSDPLPVPEQITTQEQLRCFVKKNHIRI